MKHTALLLLLFLSSLISFSQSKKEQILQLNTKIDSMADVITGLKSKNADIIDELNKEKVLCVQNLNGVKILLEEKNIQIDSFQKSIFLIQKKVSYLEEKSNKLDSINKSIMLQNKEIAEQNEQPIYEEKINTDSKTQDLTTPIIVNEYKSINDFGFEKFSNLSVDKFNVKGVLNTNSNSFTKLYKTRVTELYKNAKVNFAGKYTIIYWEAGMGTTQGTLIDFTNGKAYDIPINDGTAFNSCFNDNKSSKFESLFGSQIVFFSKNSNLLVLRSCDEYHYDGIIFRFYVWNEEMKKFNFLKMEKNVF